MMQKLGKLLQNFLEYIIPGKQRLDKSLVPYFDKLYDDNAQSYLSRVVEPETRAGESLVQMRDAFTVQRMDVEDSLNDLQEDADGIYKLMAFSHQHKTNDNCSSTRSYPNRR